MVPTDPESLNKKVADELNALRGRFGVSQAQLAAVIAVSQSQMSKRLKGRVPFILDDIEAFAEYFGISASQLLGYAETPRPDGPGGRLRARRDSNPQPSDWDSGVAFVQVRNLHLVAA